MSEITLEDWKKETVLYKNPFCSCIRYAYHDQQYRVFCIENDVIQKALVKQCIHADLTYSFYIGCFCLIEPYEEAISLAVWNQSPHSIHERIDVCRSLVFELLNRKLPESLYELIFDIASIGLTAEKEIVLFYQPNFSSLQHPMQSNTNCMLTQILLTLLRNAKETRHLHRYQNVDAYQHFIEKAEQKQFHSIPSILDDLYMLEDAFIIKKQNYDRIYRFFFLLFIIAGIFVILMIAMNAYWEWSTRTYDGLPRIGEELLGP